MNITDETKIFLCKYRVKNFIVMNGDVKIDMDPTNVLSIEIINNYEEHIFSILKVILRVDVRKKIYMLANKRDIRIKFELEKIGMDIDVEEFITSPEDVFSLVFSVYFNDEEESIDAQALADRLEINSVESETDQADLNTENYFESQNSVELYLFNPKLLKASRYLHNEIYTSGTLQNIVAQMLSISKHDKVLMSKIENIEVYKELLLPANPVWRNLLYLDQIYGFYKKGSIIFYDLDVLYILNTNGKVSAARNNEWTETSFLIPELNDVIPGSGMIRQPNEEIFYPTVSEQDVNPQKPSIMKNVSIGSKVKLVTADGTVIEDLTTESDYTDSQNTVVTYVKEENKYIGDMMQARIEENDAIIEISGNNLDINAFTPNKTFRIIYDEPTKYKKYKGEYRLAYVYHVIRVESEQFSSSSHRIILKKVK